MKESEIDRLLRQQTPTLPPPPGLKTRVCSTLRTTPRRRNLHPAWLLFPTLVVTLFIMTRAPQAEPSSPALPAIAETQEPAPALPASIESAEDIVIGNLNDETEALGRTTRRTTRFLLDRLPHLSLAE